MATINGVIHRIEQSQLLPMTIAYKKKNCRLVQICAVTTNDGYELSYSFAKGYELEHLRLLLNVNDEISSISSIYPPAFLYENEIKELFGVKINEISVDYHNRLYRINVNTPFGVKEGGAE